MSVEIDFNEVYEEFEPKILHYIARMTGIYEAEDITQEVFQKVSIALEGFKGESKLSTWIYKIATNTALDNLRSPSSKRIVRQKQIFEDEEENNLEPEAQDIWSGEKSASIEQGYVKDEMNNCIRNHIEDLQPDFRAVILLSEMEGLKNKEIAEVLGITLDTVKIRLHRGRGILKKELDSDCNFYRNEKNEPACDKK